MSYASGLHNGLLASQLLRDPMLSETQLDEILALQLGFAWAGEAGDEDERRLAWWKTDLVSKYGGQALFARIAPRTAEWASYEVAREAATRVDAERRSTDANPDNLLSLFHFGFAIDEQLQDRLLALKHAGQPPKQALARLAPLPDTWSREGFSSWISAGPAPAKPPKTVQDPSGLRLSGELPAHPLDQARALAAALASTLGSKGGSRPERYPCPHYRDARAS